MTSRPLRAALAAAAAGLLALVPTASATAAPSTSPPPGDPPGTWWYDALELDQAHERSTGAGVTIGLIDTLVDPTVPELAGADVVPALNACRSYEPDYTPQDAFGSGPAADHGTAMASLMVGTGGSNGATGQGPRGVVPDATVRVYVYNDTAEQGPDGAACSDPDVNYKMSLTEAFRQAVADGVDVISVSQSWNGDLNDVIAPAIEAGIPVVASVGTPNSRGDIGYPADQSDDIGVVAVTAVDWDAETPDYVASGDEVVISAPGVGIQCGGWVDGAWRSEAWGGGSSQATAIVSGALALVKAAYPEATGNQLVQHLVRHTTDDTLEFWPEFGFGLISVTEMLAEDPTRWADVNPLTHVSSLPALPKEYPDEAALASAGGAPSGSPTASTAPTGSAAPTASAGAPAAPGDASQDGGTAVAAWVAGALALVAVVAAAVVVARRRAGSSGPAAVQVSSSRGGG